MGSNKWKIDAGTTLTHLARPLPNFWWSTEVFAERG